MREIKFRVWDGYKIHYPTVVEIGICGVNSLTSASFQSENGGYTTSAYVMQFTGLHDKNGKEIYEGDICVEDAEYGDGCFDVVWYVDDIHCGWSISPSDVWEARVIGNIHENPELLESPDA